MKALEQHLSLVERLIPGHASDNCALNFCEIRNELVLLVDIAGLLTEALEQRIRDYARFI